MYSETSRVTKITSRTLFAEFGQKRGDNSPYKEKFANVYANLWRIPVRGMTNEENKCKTYDFWLEKYILWDGEIHIFVWRNTYLGMSVQDEHFAFHDEQD